MARQKTIRDQENLQEKRERIESAVNDGRERNEEYYSKETWLYFN